jgi:hypothetical protein
VREAVSGVPIHFRTETHISGIMATDLHTLNTVLGATIEEQVVRTLNLTRNSWDPEDANCAASILATGGTSSESSKTTPTTLRSAKPLSDSGKKSRKMPASGFPKEDGRRWRFLKS